MHAAADGGDAGPRPADWFADNLRWRLGKDVSRTGAALTLPKLPADMPGLAILDATARRFLPFGQVAGYIGFDPAREAYVQTAPWQHALRRYLQFANAVHLRGLRGLFAVNFFDAQPWDYQRDLDPPLPLPVFQITRRQGQEGVILWPAERVFMGPNGHNCPATNYDRVPFADKQPRAVWRGRLSGMLRRGDALVWAEALLRETLHRGHALSPYLLDQVLHPFPRYDFVRRYRGQTFCDVGLVQPRREHVALSEDPAFAAWAPLLTPELHRDVMFDYRFIICLEGNDYSTALFWALNSNCVVMMPQPGWQTVLHFGLRAWRHYIPLAPDCGDLEEKVAWGNENPAECEAISARARLLMAAHNHAPTRAALDGASLRAHAAP